MVDEAFDAQDSACGSAWAFVLGSAIGVAAGLLLAPRPGRESRQRLREYGRDVKEYLQEKGAAVTDAVKAGRRAMQEEHERRGDIGT